MNYLDKMCLRLIVGLSIMFLTGCEKFLAEKTSKKLVLPERIEDLQALLDNVNYTNYTGPSAASVSADDYYLTGQKFDALAEEYNRRMYTWERDYLFSTTGFNNWTDIYKSVYCANTALQGLESIPKNPQNRTAWDNVKGQALFCRGNSFLDAAGIWCLAYEATTAKSDPGLPLRFNTDFNEVSRRSDLQQTYDQIIADLKGAASLLPLAALSKHRSNKAAAYGLLSRTFLFMRNYDQAGLYADSCLALQSELLDYNSLAPTASFPFKIEGNPEILYVRYIKSIAVLSGTNPVTPTELYDLFAEGDLRKRLFFADNTDGTHYFKGGYLGSDGPNAGISTDEVLLIKAECLARTDDAMGGLSLVNRLMLKRWDKSKAYLPFTTSDSAEALRIILVERRKELMMRGLRWMDIKRLNKEGYNISLKRLINGKIYSLEANDLRFALPIPEDVIALSGMEQNRR